MKTYRQTWWWEGSSGDAPPLYDPRTACDGAWLSAKRGGISQAAGLVNSWADWRGGAFPVLTQTLTARPTYNASDAAYGGQPTVQITNVAQYMFSSALVAAAPLTLMYYGSQTGSGYVGGLLAGTSAQAPYNLMRQQSGFVGGFSWDNTAGGVQQQNFNVTGNAGVKRSQGMMVDASKNVSVLLGGSIVSVGNLTRAGTSGMLRLILGLSGQSCLGKGVELCWWRSLLSATDVALTDQAMVRDYV